MISPTCLICLNVLFVQALAAQIPSTNRMLVVASDIAAARTPQTDSQKKIASIGRSATNTPAFEEYGFHLMLTDAEQFRKLWTLDIPTSLSVQNVFFDLKATSRGIDGGIGTRDGRFVWGYMHNDFMHFVDTNYWPQSFRYKDDASAKLAKIKSKINEKEAEAIAREYLHRLGLNEKQLELIEPPSVNQYKFEETDGTVYPLPIFNIAWKIKEIEAPGGSLEMDVSGIINKPVTYFNVTRKRPRHALPTNYYEMLDVQPPTNEWQMLGFKLWPKRTNSLNNPTAK